MLYRNLNKCILIVILLIKASIALAVTPDNSTRFIEYLAGEKINLTSAINEVKLIPAPVSGADYLKKSQQNKALLALNRAKLASLDSFLVNQKKLQLDFSSRIKQLQQFNLSQDPKESAQAKIEKITTLNIINKKTIELINDNLSLALRYQDLLIEEGQTLELWKSKSDMEMQLNLLHNQEDKLNQSLNKLFENSLKLQHDIKTKNGLKPSYSLEARLLLNNQIINLTQHRIAELNMQRKLTRANYFLLKNPDIRTLQKVTDIYKNTINQLSDMEESLKKMRSVLKNEQPHVMENSLKNQFSALIRIVSSRISGITIQEQTLQEDLENHQQELKKQLSIRLNLSEYRMDTWPIILHQVSRIPNQLYNCLKSLALKVKENYLWQDTTSATLIWLMLAISGLGLFVLSKLLKRVTQDKERSRLSGHLYDGALILLSRNMPYLAVMGILFVIFYFNQIPFANYQLVFKLFFVWVIFRTLILIARLGLMERVTDASGKDVRLYYRIKWLLLAGGWTTALMVFSHELPLSLLLQDIFNRLFMLFLVAVSMVSWKSKEAIAHLIAPLLKSKKTYLRHAIILLVILAPLTLFAIAMIGLIGYINLAWTMSGYQIQILLIITGYVLARGLLFDALELLSEWMISTLKNGWLWIEVILKPLDKILRVLLLIFSLFILSQLLEWHSDSTLVSKLIQFSEFPLVNISGIHITPKSIVEFIIVASIFVWIAKWTREFCFRWLYRDVTDAGIRNSFSVFTQYAVILIGALITLYVLGLDLSGMSMVIGGLAVGMGFGLRDFASNIVGGIMLLIERPVREGDLITLGGFEGRVSHIGIRSMRVSSWDNMEVLIPNAETFNKPFTNWTHQDSIVRTVFPIKVSRADDPVMIQQIIMDVLATTPEIVGDPPAQVLLKQIDEALIEFEVRYFINVQIHTRFEIRSKVLFAITSQFKAAGVKPPIPPISIEIKEKSNEPRMVELLPD